MKEESDKPLIISHGHTDATQENHVVKVNPGGKPGLKTVWHFGPCSQGSHPVSQVSPPGMVRFSLLHPPTGKTNDCSRESLNRGFPKAEHETTDGVAV